jgi:type I site-specific restriction-modification system R (restriction) subunit
MELRNKKDLIEQFVDSVSVGAKVDAEWAHFITARKTEELDQLIAEEATNSGSAPTPVEVAQKPNAAKASFSFIDCAQKVLEEFGDKKPMHYNTTRRSPTRPLRKDGW